MENLVGKTEQEAEILLKGQSFRIVERDGKQYIVTMDLNPTRYNLTITGGVVTKVEFF